MRVNAPQAAVVWRDSFGIEHSWVSRTGASITVTLEQEENSFCASRKALPGGASRQTGSYREIVSITALSSHLTLLIAFPHSR